MKKKIDWFQISCAVLSIGSFIAKYCYDQHRFNSVIENQYNDCLDDKINKIVDEKLKDIAKHGRKGE